MFRKNRPTLRNCYRPLIVKTSRLLLIMLAFLILPAISEATPPSGAVWSAGRSGIAPEITLADVVAVSAGELHALAIRSDSTVWAWGAQLSIYNYGQLGDGTTTDRTTPVQVVGLTGAVAVSAGVYHSLALKSDGTVWSWGDNRYGQLGDGSVTNRTTPVQVTGLTDVTAIAAAGTFSLALKADGTLWAWGNNSYGELGNGSYNSSLSPVQIGDLTGVTAISAGNEQGYALKADGTVWSWGRNNYGGLGDGTTTDRNTPGMITPLGNTVVAISGSLALKGDGTVWKWGTYGEIVVDNYDWKKNVHKFNSTPVQVELKDAGKIVSISGSPRGPSLAVQDDGTIWFWDLEMTYNGTVFAHATPYPEARWNRVIGLAAGYYYHLVLTEGEPETPPLMSYASPVGGSYNLPVPVTLSTNKPATIYYTVDGTDPRTSPSAQLFTAAIPISASTTLKFHAVDAGGTARSVITENYVISNSPGLGLLRPAQSGTVVAWERNWSSMGSPPFSKPVLIPGQLGIVAISTFSNHSLSLKADGTVWAWGYNYFGALGDGTTVDRAAPVQVLGLADIVAVAAGLRHSLALKADGTVWSWGYNDCGQLGDGTTTNSSSPRRPVLSDAIAIYGGGSFSLALKADGTVWAWGANSSGQLGVGSQANMLTPVQVANLYGVTAIAAGMEQAFSLKADGTVWSWGANNLGQLGDGTTVMRLAPVQVTGLEGTVAAIGDQLALKADGTVWKWGVRAYVDGLYDATQGTYLFNTTPVQVDLTNVASIAGNHLALRQDGGLWFWGSDSIFGSQSNNQYSIPVQIPGVDGVIAMSTNGSTILILETGDLTDTIAPATIVTPTGGAYSAPQSISFTISEPGTVFYTLDGSDPKTSPTVKAFDEPIYLSSSATLKYYAMDVPGNSEEVRTELYAINAPSSPILTRPERSGTVWTWGANFSGQLGDGTTAAKSAPFPVPGLANMVAVSAGHSHSLALSPDGTVWAWGDNQSGELGNGTVSIYRLTPAQVSGLADVVAVSAGITHSLALKGDGSVWSWGDNQFGQLGDGLSKDRTIPVQVAGLSNVIAIAGGDRFSLALQADGTVWAWGANFYGQLGIGTNSGHRTPVQVPHLANVTAIAAGTYQGFALKEDGTIWTWGEGRYSPPEQMALFPEPVFGIGDKLAVTSDGTAWKWGTYAIASGNNTGSMSYNSTPVRVGLTDVVSLSGTFLGSDGNFLALKKDGTFWSWGVDHIVNGTNDNRSIPVKVTGLNGIVNYAAGSSHNLVLVTGMTADIIPPVTSATPAGGLYYVPQTVSLSANEAATIYYTIDGSDPKTSPTAAIYSGSIYLPVSATLKYFAIDNAGNSGAVRTTNYLISDWTVYSFNNADSAWIDWPAAQHGLVEYGSNIRVGGIIYWVAETAVSSWNGPGYYSVKLRPCDQTLLYPLYDYDRQLPIYADMSGSIGSRISPPTAPTAPTGVNLQTETYTSSGSTQVMLVSYNRSLSAAYGALADGASATFTLEAGQQTEDIFFNKSCDVNIRGGYDVTLSNVVGMTTIKGGVSVQRGTVAINGLTIM